MTLIGVLKTERFVTGLASSESLKVNSVIECQQEAARLPSSLLM